MSGPPPFGFSREDGRLVPDSSEARIIVALAEAFVAAGGRIKTAATAVNELGLRTRRGSIWTDSSAARVLKSPQLQQLVPEELWRRCHILLDRRADSESAPTRRPAHYFGDRIACACGGRCQIRRSSTGGHLACKSCKRKLDLVVAEHALVKALNSVSFTGSAVRKATTKTPENERLSSIWPRLDDQAKRQLVDLLVKQLVVSSDTIQVRFLGLTGRKPAKSANSLPSSSGRAGPEPGATSRTTRAASSEMNGEDVEARELPTRTLRIKQVAKILNLPVTTIHDLIRRRVLEAVKIGSGRRKIVLIPEQAVEALLDQHRVPTRERKGG